MSKLEKEEIAGLPEKYRPFGAWSFFGFTILYAIPVVGLICCIVFSCLGGNITRRSFARSYLIFGIIEIIATIVLSVLIGLGIIVVPQAQ